MSTTIRVYNEDYALREGNVVYCYDLIDIEEEVLITFWRLVSMAIGKGKPLPVLAPVVFVDKKDKDLYMLVKKLGQVPPSTYLFMVSSREYNPEQQYRSFASSLGKGSLVSVASLIGKRIDFSNVSVIEREEDIKGTINFLDNYGKKYLDILEELSKEHIISIPKKRFGFVFVDDDLERKKVNSLAEEIFRKLNG
jgi:hypothetical protein